ncbi:MAG: hypothetical protein JXQ93_05045 [Flavobacteriaceae bacterium]
MKYTYKLAILLFLIPALSFGNNDKKKHEKSKNVSKKYTVNSDAKVAISNKYGTIKVTTWNKNTVEIDVTITVKGNDLDDVEDKLSDIYIDFSGSSNLVEAKTRFGNDRRNSWSWFKKSKKINYQIDYLVKMPVTNDVSLNNDYGSIYLDETTGNANINCDYGKISIGNLKGNENTINLDYCRSSSISSMSDGSINIDYSKLTIDSAKNVDLNTDYSTVKFGRASDISFNADYGSIYAKEVDNVKGNGDYTGLKFGTLNNSLKVKSDYGYIKIENLANGFDFVDIDSEYAGIKIGTSTSNSFSFVIDLQYASFKQRNSPNVELFKSISKSSKKHYEGVYGKGKSNSKITIKSEFGSVSFDEN